QHPHPAREERRLAAAASDGGKYGACAYAFLLPQSMHVTVRGVNSCEAAIL
ncbi:hypothetical protein HMPREF1548_02016, partial [Clostridium sp. KLE 1755]